MMKEGVTQRRGKANTRWISLTFKSLSGLVMDEWTSVTREGVERCGCGHSLNSLGPVTGN